MKVAIYLGKTGAEVESRLGSLMAALTVGGCECVRFDERQHLPEDADMMLSVGGDGTFLSAARIAAEKGIPVAGVNLGRLGFLSENRPEDVAQSILSGDYEIEERAMLKVSVSNASGNEDIGGWPYALNEVTVHRNGAAMLGVDVCLDGKWLPTYWADGLIVSTSSGSTAYSLSVGGPIVLPQAKVLIISPIAPHNLNIRPPVVPDTSEILLRLHTRDGNCILTADNHTAVVDEDVEITVGLAHFSLRRVRLNRSDFINALTEKLHWGEDIRNNK